MKQVKGNLLDMFDDELFDVIIHGCNCWNSMSGGIAYQIAQRYPTVQQADEDTVVGEEQKLGTIGPVLMSGWQTKYFPMLFQRRYIINAYTQYHPGANANLKAIAAAFGHLDDAAASIGLTNARIGIPAIGCGIGGLTWEQVEPVIERVCPNLDITLVVFE